MKYGYKEKAECILCKKAYEESGGSWKGELPKETIGHIQSAGCLAQKEVVTAAHHACIRELLQEIDVHGKADRHMKLLTLERESSLRDVRVFSDDDSDTFVYMNAVIVIHGIVAKRAGRRHRDRKRGLCVCLLV